MKLGIMQPYLFPYIGYFQLIKYVDEFVIYDNIQYTKKGWINRNRILQNGKDVYFSVPLKKDSDYLDINERVISEKWSLDHKKTLNKIRESYRKAPNFELGFKLVEDVFLLEENNLFNFLHKGLQLTLNYLEIDTPVIASSTFEATPNLKAQNRVLEICKQRNATDYINPIGGLELYSKDVFKEHNIELHFMNTTEVNYDQYGHGFVPFLSIIDVIMFNDLNKIHHFLDKSFELI